MTTHRFTAAALFAGALITACDQTDYPEREPTYIQNAAADSVVFWPPALKYARAGDTVSFRVMGLQRGYACAKVVDAGWTWRDSIGRDYYTLHTLIQVPGAPRCAFDTGLDTLFKRVFPSPSGEKLYLQTSAGKSTDSLLFVAGNGYTETFTHLASGPDTARVVDGRFLFHDSTAERPRRFVTADSLPSCETFQSAAFKRSGDTLTVRLKRIVAVPLSAEVFPPCAGVHADTLDVVFDRFRFP